jgi:hypothetical protein
MFVVCGNKPEMPLLKRRFLVAVRAADAAADGFATCASQRRRVLPDHGATDAELLRKSERAGVPSYQSNFPSFERWDAMKVGSEHQFSP